MLIVKENVLLAQYTGFKIGGPADYFCEPKSKKELVDALLFARKNKIPYCVLGGGYNLLVSDTGFRGIVIRPQINFIKIEKKEIRAGSGASIKKLIEKSLSRGLVGLEEFSGIPGTIGGALFINIHYYKSLIGNFVQSILCIDKFGKEHLIKNGGEKWKYEESGIQKRKLIVVEAEFKLKKVAFAEKWKAVGKSEEIIRARFYKYPQEPSVGCIFQNIDKGKFYGVPSVPAAYYIDRLGLKGTRVGNAEISEKHANMIVNTGNAKAKDVIALARKIKSAVKKKFRIELAPEVQFIGFEKPPF